MLTTARSLSRSFDHSMLLLAISLLPSPLFGQTPSVVGQWSAPFDLNEEAIHAQVLPTGKILFWGLSGSPKLWDPLTLAITAAAPVTALASDANLFCTGHSFLPDGTVLVAGGHVTGNVGQKYAFIYDAFRNTWTRLPDMNAARWYPTNTTLANGDVLVVSGQIDTTQGMNPLPQVWETSGGRWRDLSTAEFVLPFYPYMYAAPNGKVFMAGPEQLTKYLDTTGTGTWANVGSSNFGVRNWGSSVMYEPGKVLILGGVTCPMYGACGVFPTATAEAIDLNSATPAWQFVGSLGTPRKHHNSILLPNGKVLATGGSAGTEDTNSNSTNPAYMAEMWDPAAPGTWTPLVPNTVYRGYHAVSLLLPDGRVLSAGGDFGGTTAEIYSPAYLFNGARPTISSVPAVVNYGQSFFVGTSDAAGISSVTWLSPSAVTHTFNEHQRFNRLNFSQATGGVNVTAPASANVCPPGLYMLFILNGQGIPSIAKFVRIQSGPAAPPAPPTGLTATVSGVNVTVRWADNSTNETGFDIERSTTSATAGFVRIATIGANQTQYKDTTTQKRNTYWYRVRACNSSGCSVYSNVVQASL